MGVLRNGCKDCVNKLTCNSDSSCLLKIAPTYICDICGKKINPLEVRMDGDLILHANCYKR